MLLPADPKASYLAHADEIHEALERVLKSGTYILGPEVGAFENEFAEYIGAAACVSVANGTEALEIALRALGIRAGDCVATVGNTVTATIAAIEQLGAEPVLVEVDDETLVMSPSALESVCAREGEKLKAVIAVHLYGNPAPMPEIVELAARFNLAVVEDCAQAHGAAIAGRKVGAWGNAAAFSFYPTKNLGALGDGGAITTNDAALADRLKLFRQYGWRTRYVAEQPGRNSRLDELQAAVLRVKLKYLEKENARRRHLAERYHQNLKHAGLKLPRTTASAIHVYHQYAIRTPHREALREHLHAQDIACGVLYPVPVHRQPAYCDVGLKLPITEEACASVLCLPCHPGLRVEDIDRVSEAILGWRAPQ